jgi:DNA-3-methyladenine glycosylase
MAKPSVLDILMLPATEAAPRLVGAVFTFDGCAGRIVEVEAYTEDDPASHSYGGRRPRNATMFMEAGSLYVYRSYGVHWCANVVTGPEGSGQAVLLRAVEPLAGLPKMRRRRKATERRLCAGPGNLTAAFGLSGKHDGIVLGRDYNLELGTGGEVWVGPRIGITQVADWPRRFFDAGSPFLSRGPGPASRPLDLDGRLFLAKAKKVRTI